MVLDLLENLRCYEALNPHFSKVIDFVEKVDFASLPLGRNEICGDSVFANVMEVKPKSKTEAFVEIHRKYIDIQIPISSVEIMGYTPVNELPDANYSATDDVAIYPVGMPARDYLNVRKGEFVIFFPQDGHAPAITSAPLKKVVIKVAVE